MTVDSARRTEDPTRTMLATTATSAVRGLRAARRGFRAFRATRPFWGGLLLMLAGAEIIQLMSFSLGFVIRGGWSASAGYVLGGALVIFGLTAWVAPHYSPLVGLLGVLVALAAFVSANLGGYLVGTLLGIFGGSMVWGWGEKGPSRRQRRAAQRPATEAGQDDGPAA